MQARAEQALATNQQLSAIPALTASMEQFTKSLEHLDISALTKEAGEAKQQIAEAKAAAQAVLKQMQELKSVPLGRPTEFAGRSVQTDPAAASYQDIARLGSGGPQQVNGLPEGVKDVFIEGVGFKRYWPAGVGGIPGESNSQRPVLDAMTKASMRMAEWMAYEEGKEASVPLATYE